MNRTYLVVDTSAAVATLALGASGGSLWSRSLPQKQTSEHLLATIDELLAEAEFELSGLAGLVAINGPGSFTGLRIGLATLYGLHQATDVPATTVSTLEALGRIAPQETVALAMVDALRGEWFAQSFRGGAPCQPLPEPTVRSRESLAALGIAHWVGFDEREPGSRPATIRSAPTHLAAQTLESLDPGRLVWDAARLLHPLYLRAPAVSRPTSKSTGPIG